MFVQVESEKRGVEGVGRDALKWLADPFARVATSTGCHPQKQNRSIAQNCRRVFCSNPKNVRLDIAGASQDDSPTPLRKNKHQLHVKIVTAGSRMIPIDVPSR